MGCRLTAYGSSLSWLYQLRIVENGYYDWKVQDGDLQLLHVQTKKLRAKNSSSLSPGYATILGQLITKDIN
jgi:hypothetical protein